MAKKQSNNSKVVNKPLPPKQVEVTNENAAKLQVHFASQSYARLGYIIKLLEEIKKK